ncbi:hypothetical protein IMSAGC012_00703 [Lachnospiraceae bacterium]|nr:hypothetical protein IMSAGC012_00703 [Lachnospiraceae bacterium]
MNTKYAFYIKVKMMQNAYFVFSVFNLTSIKNNYAVLLSKETGRYTL